MRWTAWTVREHESDRVVVEHVIHPRPGYPFSLALSIEYRLSGEGLRVATTATNVGAARCPYGCGAHPYLTLGTATIDSLALQVPAGTVLQSDERGIPVGTAPVEGTEYDFRQPREIGRTEMDNGFTDLERDHEGVARVELRDPNGGRAVSLWVDESYPYLMIFTGDPLPDVARRSLAVEPMTCPPNAFRTGQDLLSLDPGRSVTCSWGIRPGPPSPRPGDVDDPRVG